jgi:hypothetical protein
MALPIPWRRIRLVLTYAILFVAIVWTIQWEHVPPGSFGARLDRILRGNYFDFLTWEAEALLGKIGQELTTPQDYLDGATRKQIVLDYLDLVKRIHQVEGEIARLYTDPTVTDPEAASAGQRATLERLRAQQARIQGTAEAILEEQVASVLHDEGFAILGRVLPPVRFHFTPLPNYLIISPRSEIALTHGAMLRGDIELDHIEALESEIDETFDVSSLIESIVGADLGDRGHRPRVGAPLLFLLAETRGALLRSATRRAHHQRDRRRHRRQSHSGAGPGPLLSRAPAAPYTHPRPQRSATHCRDP